MSKDSWADFPAVLYNGWDLFTPQVRARMMGKYMTFNYTDFKEMVNNSITKFTHV